jgi:hypothetical protein
MEGTRRTTLVSLILSALSALPFSSTSAASTDQAENLVTTADTDDSVPSYTPIYPETDGILTFRLHWVQKHIMKILRSNPGELHSADEIVQSIKWEEADTETLELSRRGRYELVIQALDRHAKSQSPVEPRQEDGYKWFTFCEDVMFRETVEYFGSMQTPEHLGLARLDPINNGKAAPAQ